MTPGVAWVGVRANVAVFVLLPDVAPGAMRALIVMSNRCVAAVLFVYTGPGLYNLNSPVAVLNVVFVGNDGAGTVRGIRVIVDAGRICNPCRGSKRVGDSPVEH